MPFTNEDLVFYKNLMAAISEPKFEFVQKYIKDYREKVLSSLMTAEDQKQIYRIQGELAGLNKFLNIKTFVASVFR